MFTGIVEDTGTISVLRSEGETLIGIKPSAMDAGVLKIGESISVDGVCLTVVSVEGGIFFIQASAETLSKTTLSSAAEGVEVNLERAVTAGGLMGGHIVTGHIDGVASVLSAGPCGESVEFRFSLPGGFMRYVVRKGSIAINGVSLTVNDTADDGFSVNVIPHTLSRTNFSALSAGSRVNFECDILAKHIERLMRFGAKKSD